MLKFWLKKKEKEITLTELKADFFSEPLHAWMNESTFVKRAMESFLDSLPKEALNFMGTHQVLMLKSSGRYALAVQPGSHVIVIFPELYKLLSSFSFDTALMMMAHELGHILYEHGKKIIDPLMAQVEADRFAIHLGYGHELEIFLLEQPESIEKRTRLTYLTSQLIIFDHENAKK
ncbi:MAG: hypothetical protein ACOYL6_11435 [Bacteriovoracaceae bacterium]